MSDPLSLDRLRPALEGVVAGVLATTDADGHVNVSLISQVHYVDTGHIALSYQFFNKTKRNILATRRASVVVVHYKTAERFRLSLDYVETQVEGPVFEDMRARLIGIASHTGMTGVFRLLGADIFRVTRIERISGPTLPAPAPAFSRLNAARRVAHRFRKAEDAGELADEMLSAIVDEFDVSHAIFLANDPDEARLFTLASQGYSKSGIGSEIRHGDGVAGVAAKNHIAIHIGMMSAEYRYSEAVVDTARSLGFDAHGGQSIPFPGLEMPGSQLAIPMRCGKRLMGVLLLESPDFLHFSHDDEDALTLLADQAGALMAALESDWEEPVPAVLPVAPPCELTVRHFCHDDSVFLDHDYLIKGVAGAILWRLLNEHSASGRTEFTTRELRLDPALPLPARAENLDTRLILLRRRLEERESPIRISRTGRGRFSLSVAGRLDLVEVASAT